MQKNIEIRMELLKSGFCQWQLARELNIAESQMSRMLRFELEAEEKERLLHAISEMKRKREQEATESE